VPDVRGMGLKDALYLLESMDMRVSVKGAGKVKMQSVAPGAAFKRGETISLELN